MDKQIRKASFAAVAETCPAVDEALELAADRIKEQTGALREALEEYIGLYLEATDRIEDLEAENKQLKDEVQSLRAELES